MPRLSVEVVATAAKFSVQKVDECVNSETSSLPTILDIAFAVLGKSVD